MNNNIGLVFHSSNFDKYDIDYEISNMRYASTLVLLRFHSLELYVFVNCDYRCLK